MKDIILTQTQTLGQGGDIQGDSQGEGIPGRKNSLCKSKYI